MLRNDKERLNFILSEMQIGQQAIADALQVPVHKIKSIKIGKVKFSTELALAIEQKFNFSFRWILTGEGDPYIKENDKKTNFHPESLQQIKPDNVIELQHMELVKGFRDKQRALNINRELMELEGLDPEVFRRVESYIKGTVDAVREVAERRPRYGDRRQVDRRSKEDPGKGPPDNQDRRSGQDRRNTSGRLKASAARKGAMLLV